MLRKTRALKRRAPSGRSAAPDCCPERYSSLETSKKLRDLKKNFAARATPTLQLFLA